MKISDLLSLLALLLNILALILSERRSRRLDRIASSTRVTEDRILADSGMIRKKEENGNE